MKVVPILAGEYDGIGEEYNEQIDDITTLDLFLNTIGKTTDSYISLKEVIIPQNRT